MSPRRRAMLAVVGALVATLVLVGIVVVVGGQGTVAVPADRPGPVLLVAGYGGNTRALAPLAGALRAAGRTVEVVPPTGEDTGDLTAQAQRLAAVAHRMVSASGVAVDVVGYSAGGVVARIWVTRLGGVRSARRIVTIGSPHHGTDVAALAVGLAGACPVACQQLTPGSGLLSGLPDTVPGPVWTSIWTSTDTVVTPPDSARLAGAVDVTLQGVCPDARTSHGQLPSDPLVIGLVDHALDAAAVPGTPTAGQCTLLRERGSALVGGRDPLRPTSGPVVRRDSSLGVMPRVGRGCAAYEPVALHPVGAVVRPG